MVNPEEAVIVNALVRQALVSAQEVMGGNGLNAVLRSVGLERFIGNIPPDDTNPGMKTVDYARLNESIEAFYGRRKGDVAVHWESLFSVKRAGAGRFGGCGRSGDRACATKWQDQIRSECHAERLKKDQSPGGCLGGGSRRQNCLLRF